MARRKYVLEILFECGHYGEVRISEDELIELSEDPRAFLSAYRCKCGGKPNSFAVWDAETFEDVTPFCRPTKEVAHA